MTTAAKQGTARVAEPALRGEEAGLIRRLDDLAMHASHDLSAPLLMISAAVEELRERMPTDDPELWASIRTMDAGLRRMRMLVDGLTEYTRTGREVYEREPVDCGEVVEETVRSLSLMVRELDATIVVGDLPVVPGYPVLLHQLFQNLIVNALKFHGEDPPRIEITARAARRGSWRFTVRDNGVGIAEHDLERIFDLFARSAEHRDRAGSGIGLAIAARAVERHGGRMWAESDGTGSAFHFTLSSR